jgi:hypothetical protein
VPYISQDRREDAQRRPESVGELTYAISALIEDYRQRKGDRFQTFAEVRAALASADDEFAERVVRPYEGVKLIENGEVHEHPTLRRMRLEQEGLAEVKRLQAEPQPCAACAPDPQEP